MASPTANGHASPAPPGPPVSETRYPSPARRVAARPDRSASRARRALPSPSATATALLLIQSPVLAILILLIVGSRAAGPSAVAATTFALALSATWLGGSLATWIDRFARPDGDREWTTAARLMASRGARLAAITAVLSAQCGMLLAIVHRGDGLRGSWPLAFGVLFLTSGVGLALGSAIFSLVRSTRIALAALMLGFAAMIAMGGGVWTLPPSSLAARIAAAMPSRWAFEGLLLLEAEGHRPTGSPHGSVPDLAEDYFPADSERMGPRADAIALASMLIALAAIGRLSPSPSRPRR